MTAREAMEDTVDYFQREMESLQEQSDKLASLYAESLAKRHVLANENAALRLEIIALKKRIELNRTEI